MIPFVFHLVKLISCWRFSNYFLKKKCVDKWNYFWCYIISKNCNCGASVIHWCKWVITFLSCCIFDGLNVCFLSKQESQKTNQVNFQTCCVPNIHFNWIRSKVHMFGQKGSCIIQIEQMIKWLKSSFFVLRSEQVTSNCSFSRGEKFVLHKSQNQTALPNPSFPKKNYLHLIGFCWAWGGCDIAHFKQLRSSTCNSMLNNFSFLQSTKIQLDKAITKKMKLSKLSRCGWNNVMAAPSQFWN